MVGTMYLSTNNELSEEDLVHYFLRSSISCVYVCGSTSFFMNNVQYCSRTGNSSLNVSAMYVLISSTLPGIFLIAVMSRSCGFLADLNAFVYFLLNLFFHSSFRNQ
ncbi:hypothetical protein Plhal304r1_c080g0166391 [Plasmopara halstedii]